MSKHVVKLKSCLPMCKQTSYNCHVFRRYVKTRRTICIMFANVSKRVLKLTWWFVHIAKHVVQLTWFLQMCQNTLLNSHVWRKYVKTRRKMYNSCANVSKHVVKSIFVCTYVKTRRNIDMIFANVTKLVVQLTLNWASAATFANIHSKVLKMLQMEFLRPLLPMSTAEAPTA